MSIDYSARPTIGRDRELDQLDAALQALDDDVPACLAVEGEPGIGKTRLLHELRDRAERRGHLVLAGSAAEFERSMPFSVWADALDAYVAAQGIEPAAADDLAEILPSLRRPGASASAVADERYRAHRAMRGLLALLATDRPLVLVLDDLHWSDQASIDLVAALLRRTTDAPVLLALAFRPGQAPAALTAALATPAVQRIALQQLSEHDAVALLGEAAGARAIYRRAGGNPFYLEQLARVAPGAGAADAEAEVGGIPAAVAASLAEELASLGPAERALLEGAAVAGEPFEPDLAAFVGELSVDAGLEALDALLARDLLRPTTVPRRFRFRHPLVRRAVYDATRGGWRLNAHA
ncbi:MAG TPA: AAA family ATPase, partial [Solirubrobacteraceae bacterium]|nr:AAA family ATPase [Solirubrobacteraceae bacterium]